MKSFPIRKNKQNNKGGNRKSLRINCLFPSFLKTEIQLVNKVRLVSQHSDSVICMCVCVCIHMYTLSDSFPLFVVVVQLLSCVQIFVTAWTAAHQAPLSFTISWSLLKFMSLDSVMLSYHLILFCFLFSPSIFPSIRVFFLIGYYKILSIVTCAIQQ